MKVLGVEFAPMRLPLQRRLQTFAVTLWICSYIFMGLSATVILLYWLFYTRLWPLSVAYGAWLIYDREQCNRGGRRWQWVRRWPIWRWYRDFFPIHIVKTCELDPSQNYLAGSHPHGVLCAGASCNFCSEANDFSRLFPGITPYLLTLEGNYWEPLFREFLMTAGGAAANTRSMQYLLSQRRGGNLVVLVVGGAAEALMAQPGSAQLYYNTRKGFIKIALRTGSPLVPVYSFGETDVYWQVGNPAGSRLRRFQEAVMHYMGLPPVLFMGRGMLQYTFGIVPFRRPITTVVGRPIPVEKTPQPTQDQIDDLHTKYRNALKDLYDTYRHKYASDPSVDIEFT